jgi:hypothetical protein
VAPAGRNVALRHVCISTAKPASRPATRNVMRARLSSLGLVNRAAVSSTYVGQQHPLASAIAQTGS